MKLILQDTAPETAADYCVEPLQAKKDLTTITIIEEVDAKKSLPGILEARVKHFCAFIEVMLYI